MLATVYSAALIGVDAHPVQVEVNTGEVGEPRIFMVGLPDAAVKESTDRVKSALMNCGYKAPETRTTINLAPGSIRKEGPMYDLPIALGLLASTGQLGLLDRITARLKNFLIAGELGLSGQTRPVRGGLALARLARKHRIGGVILPEKSAAEAALVEGVEVIAVRSLDHAVAFLLGQTHIEPLRAADSPFHASGSHTSGGSGLPNGPDFAEVKGQATVRRAVEIAVAGGHNLLLVGPPGSGKSMIAQRIAGIMPAPSLDEFLEILAVQSAAGLSLSGEAQSFARPFRAPHHTISEVGLIGGGSNPGPGEISLAHHGVLFLDELPEFRRSTLEVLRQPLEDGEVTISRSAGKVTLPAAAMLVAAMNPCPCGYLGDPRHECRCTPTMIQRYRSRISGPLLDRIDLHVEAPALSFEDLRSERPCESSASIRARVEDARALQARRYGSAEGSTPADSALAATATTGDTATTSDSAAHADTQHSAAHLSATAAATATINDTGPHSDTTIHTPAEHHAETATAAGAPRCNARMSHRQLRRFCALDKEQADLLQQAMEELSLSARAYDRILKVARTIADLEASETIQTHHLLEAIQYRSLDRRLFY